MSHAHGTLGIPDMDYDLNVDAELDGTDHRDQLRELQDGLRHQFPDTGLIVVAATEDDDAEAGDPDNIVWMSVDLLGRPEIVEFTGPDKLVSENLDRTAGMVLEGYSDQLAADVLHSAYGPGAISVTVRPRQ